MEDYSHSSDPWDILFTGKALNDSQMEDVGREIFYQTKLGSFLSRFIPRFLQDALTPNLICRRMAANWINTHNDEILKVRFDLAPDVNVTTYKQILQNDGWQLKRQLLVFADDDVIGPKERPIVIAPAVVHKAPQEILSGLPQQPTDFVDRICTENQFTIRKSIDNGNCLFASCLDEDEDPAFFREQIYEWITAHIADYNDDIQVYLSADIDAATDPKENLHEREKMIAKLPQNLQTIYRKLDSVRELQPSEYGNKLEDWLDGSAINDYIKGMKNSRAYPAEIECRAIAEYLERPICIYNPLYQNADGSGGFLRIEPSSHSDAEPINILYNPDMKHYDRLV